MIVDKYIAQLEKLNSTFSDDCLELVINKEWKKISPSLQIIYCGDNPGKREKESNQYFKGYAGNELNDFVELHQKINNVTETAFFNKTPFYSPKTSDLTKSLDKNNNEVIKQSIRLTLQCLYDLWIANDKKLQLIFFGVNEKAYIVKTFKEILIDEFNEFSQQVTILNHPSHNSLYAEIGKTVLKELTQQDNLNITFQELVEKTQRHWFDK